MTAMRRELAEDILKKVNGGFYYDTDNGLLGISKDGPLYKFADPDIGELFRELYLGVREAQGEHTAEDIQALDKVVGDFLAQGILVPYQS